MVRNSSPEPHAASQQGVDKGREARQHTRMRLGPLPDAIAFRVNEVAIMGGPKRTKLYQLAAQGRLKLVRAGGRTLVDGDSLRALLRGLDQK